MSPSRSALGSAAPSLRLVEARDVGSDEPGATGAPAAAGAPSADLERRLTDSMNAFALLRFQNARLVERVSETMRITPTDFRALIHVSTHDDVTPKQIAEHLGLTTGAMTALVDRVEAAGLAERTANPNDRRSLLIRLTQSGRDAVDFGGRVYGAAFGAAIDEADLDTVTRTFIALSERLSEAADRLS